MGEGGLISCFSTLLSPFTISKSSDSNSESFALDSTFCFPPILSPLAWAIGNSVSLGDKLSSLIFSGEFILSGELQLSGLTTATSPEDEVDVTEVSVWPEEETRALRVGHFVAIDH